MGLVYRQRIRLGRLFTLNLSKSGVSLSAHARRTTFNSRGRVSVRLGHGLSYRSRI